MEMTIKTANKYNTFLRKTEPNPTQPNSKGYSLQKDHDNRLKQITEELGNKKMTNTGCDKQTEDKKKNKKNDKHN